MPAAAVHLFDRFQLSHHLSSCHSQPWISLYSINAVDIALKAELSIQADWIWKRDSGNGGGFERWSLPNRLDILRG